MKLLLSLFPRPCLPGRLPGGLFLCELLFEIGRVFSDVTRYGLGALLELCGRLMEFLVQSGRLRPFLDIRTQALGCGFNFLDELRDLGLALLRPVDPPLYLSRCSSNPCSVDCKIPLG